MKAVAYLRVSTMAQGRSGLGLEAQEAAVLDYASRVGAKVIATFTEVESGKRDSRPQLAAALRHARQTGAVLLIAKLDRLSRNAAFLLTLRDSGVRFRAADMPDASDLTIGLMAVIAQAEREAISRRTKEALAMVKQRLKENNHRCCGLGKCEQARNVLPLAASRPSQSHTQWAPTRRLRFEAFRQLQTLCPAGRGGAA